jgi:uncharacterized protein (DUF2141 family)
MKKIVLFSILINTAFIAFAQNKIVANITQLENNKGVVRTCLFNSAASFNGEGGTPFKCLTVGINNKTAQVVFNNVPDGTYALFVFHDVNNNNKMDKNFLGIPSEGYGASKNKLPFASAPTFNSNKFVVQNNVVVNLPVRLRNL